MARGTRCRAHKHDAVVAEENHHLRPQSRGGATEPENLRYLCANAHSDTHYLLDLIEKYAKPLIGLDADPDDPVHRIPWSVMRTYGPGVRDAALDGWSEYAEEFLRGDFARHAALWSTSGRPHDENPIPGIPRALPSFAAARALGVLDAWLDAAQLVAAAPAAPPAQ